MARPIVALSNKDIGFLPGDIQSKLDPYMKPLYDNLGVIQHAEGDTKNSQVIKLLEDGKLVIEPLSYIRGRSLVNTFFIVDEAQNLPDRPSLPRQPLKRVELPDREDEGPTAVCPRESNQGRTFRARRPCGVVAVVPRY